MPVRNLHIRVPHLTRVEGHGNIVVDMQNGKLIESKLHIVESPRYFEGFVRGRSWSELSFITSRICGICSVGHTLTSLKATEAALGVEVSPQTITLRKMLVDAALLQSHILHVYFLVAPDLVGTGSVFPIIQTMPEVALRALRLKKLSNDICDLLGGRTIHPTTPYVGGFTGLPRLSELKEMHRRLLAAQADIHETVETISSLVATCAEAGIIPLEFTRPTEYISLRCADEYAMYAGDIYSSDTGALPDREYRKVTNEFLPSHSTAKHARFNRESYAVGALARLNNNPDRLGDLAQKTAARFGLESFPVENPFLNTVAQVIEIAECYQRLIGDLEQLMTRGIKPAESLVDPRQIRTQSGTGIGATEVPRGILFHEYTFDSGGICVAANCVIPTGQNFGNIDRDMAALIPWLVEREYNEEQITHALEMLVRAYDPCISCSVHMLEVSFI